MWKGVSLWGTFSTALNLTQIHRFKCALLVSDLIYFNQAFLPKSDWFAQYKVQSKPPKNVPSHFSSKDPPFWETAPIIIARQNKYGGGGLSCLPLIFPNAFERAAFTRLFALQALWLPLIHVGIISNSLTWQKGLSRTLLDLIMR